MPIGIILKQEQQLSFLELQYNPTMPNLCNQHHSGNPTDNLPSANPTDNLPSANPMASPMVSLLANLKIL
jgi:hypothetical protein